MTWENLEALGAIAAAGLTIAGGAYRFATNHLKHLASKEQVEALDERLSTQINFMREDLTLIKQHLLS